MRIPLVNIIILNFNGHKDTIECIESLKKVNYKNWKITLVDNGSSRKDVEELIKKYSKDMKIKFILNRKNIGFAGGNNLGMRKDLFNSDYFLLLNNDTIVDKNFLRILLEEKKDLISPLVYNYYSKKELSQKDYPGKFNLFIGGGRAINPIGRKLNKVNYCSGCCWLIKKALFLETGGFNEKYFAYNEEIEWAYRLKKRGHDFFINSRAKIWHKGARTSSKMSGLKLKLMTRNILFFERKYANKKEYFIFLCYLFLYKIPKNLLKIIIFGEKIKNNIHSFLLGIKEGLRNNVS